MDRYFDRIKPIIKNSFIIFDTCAFIDSSRHFKKFKEFFNFLEDSNCKIITVFDVATEFLKGSNNFKDYLEKKEQLEDIIETVIYTDKEIYDNIDKILPLFQFKGEAPSSADFALAGALMKFKNISLFTRDHQHFSRKMFDRIEVLPIEYDQEVHAYGFYKFSEDKYKQRRKKLLREMKKLQKKQE